MTATSVIYIKHRHRRWQPSFGFGDTVKSFYLFRDRRHLGVMIPHITVKKKVSSHDVSCNCEDCVFLLYLMLLGRKWQLTSTDDSKTKIVCLVKIRTLEVYTICTVFSFTFHFRSFSCNLIAFPISSILDTLN